MTTVAVIGAGISGLAAVKSCLEEGLQPTCFEIRNDLGGLWNYSTNVVDGLGSVMHCTNLNTSKELTAFSDFPMPKDYPSFPSHNKILDYLHLYANNFGLTKCIKFNVQIINILQEENHRWNVVAKDLKSGKESEMIFDIVMICTGHHGEKYIPDIAGMEKYKGQIFHSHEYRHFNQFENQRVVVVGLGNSGVDTSTDIALSAKQVYLSTDNGAWLLPRMLNNLPYDMIFMRHTTIWRFQFFPQYSFQWVRRQVNNYMDHRLFCLEAARNPFTATETVSDEIPNRIVTGRIVIKPSIKNFEDRDIVFTDGTTERNIDIVLFSTGFKLKFPNYVSAHIKNLSGNKMQFYKYVVPANCQKPNLFYIGFIDAIGALPPIIELQTRMAVAMITGKIQLPPCKTMWQDIEMKRNIRESILKEKLGKYIQVDHLGYFQELCSIVGCHPKLWKLAITDPALAIKCVFGPLFPAQARLHGPGSWPGARESIMQAWDRTFYSMQTRPLPRKAEKFHYWHLLVIMSVASTGLYFMQTKYNFMSSLVQKCTAFRNKFI